MGMVLTEYREAKNKPGKPYETIANALQHIEAFFGSLLLENITPALSRQYIADRRKLGRAYGTIRRELGAFQAAINHCIKEGWKIPSPPIILPQANATRDIWLSKAEVRKLVDCSQDHIKLFILIAYTTCTRKQAVLELTWDRVNLFTRLIDFREPEERETNKRRGVKRINNWLLPELEKALELAQTDYVIEYCGKPVVNNIRRGFMTAVKKAGLPDTITPHILKHSACVHMAMDKTPLEEIKQMADHSSIRTTEKHYLKYHPDFMKRASKALER